MATTSIMIGTILVHLGCSTIFLTLIEIFKLKELKKSIKEMDQSPPNESRGQRVVIIKSSSESKAWKVILEKPIMEMTRHIRPLYVKAHFNRKLVSKMLIDNGLTMNTRQFKDNGSEILKRHQQPRT